MSVAQGPSSAERQMLMVRVCPQQKAALQFRTHHALGFSIWNNSKAEMTPWPFLRVTDSLGVLIHLPILYKRQPGQETRHGRKGGGQKKKKKKRPFLLSAWLAQNPLACSPKQTTLRETDKNQQTPVER